VAVSGSSFFFSFRFLPSSSESVCSYIFKDVWSISVCGYLFGLSRGPDGPDLIRFHVVFRREGCRAWR